MIEDLVNEELGHSASMEMCLIGNIMMNLNLIPQYKDKLKAEDFEDECQQFLFHFLTEYYQRFGPEFENVKIQLLAAEHYERNPKLKKWSAPTKFITNIISPHQRLGVDDQPADSYAFRTVKRNSTIRQLRSAGFPVENLLKNENINEMAAEDVIRGVQRKLDELAEDSSLSCTEELGSNLVAVARQFLDIPEYGLQTPFDFINHHMHGLYKNDVTMLGGVSNSGKGRCLTSILAYLICVENQKVYLMSNEMTISDYYKVLICTIINSPAIQKLHGKKLRLTQSDIVQSRFRDRNGDVINRLDEEDATAFETRLLELSEEYKEYASVVQWFQDNYSDKIYVVNVSSDYSIDRLKAEIRKAENMGCSVVAYDTLKAYQSAEWTDLYLTATTLVESIKASSMGLHGIFTFQLTDDVNSIPPEKLGASNIAHSKNIINVADNMIMFQQLPANKNRFYQVDICGFNDSLPSDKQFAAFKIVKNRRGGGKGVMYGVQNNLDLNCWEYIAELYPISKKQVEPAC